MPRFFDIYYTAPFADFVPEHNAELQKLKNGTYYQTFGGGPEGGYVVLGDQIWSVERGWFQEFKAKKLRKNMVAQIVPESALKSGMSGILLFQKPKDGVY